MIEISVHARVAMSEDGISEEEINMCLERGELEIKQLVQEEMRYGKQLEFKDKTIMVIYTYRKEGSRVITAYLIRRKKWQQNK